MRRQRGLRSKPTPAVITARDLGILLFLGRVRFATSHQVARALEFPSVDRCLRRLRVLFDLGYATNTYRDSRQANLVSATRLGIAEVVQLHPHLEGQLSTAGTIRGPAVPHALAVVDARIYAERWGRTPGAPLLAWHGPRHTETEARFKAVQLRPDGLAIFSGKTSSSVPIAAAIEVDCGTESAKTLAAKLTSYGAIFRRTPPGLGELWFIATGGDRRLGLIAELVRDARLHHVVRIFPLDYITKTPVPPLVPLVARQDPRVFESSNTPKDAPDRSRVPSTNPGPGLASPAAIRTPARGAAW